MFIILLLLLLILQVTFVMCKLGKILQHSHNIDIHQHNSNTLAADAQHSSIVTERICTCTAQATASSSEWCFMQFSQFLWSPQTKDGQKEVTGKCYLLCNSSLYTNQMVSRPAIIIKISWPLQQNAYTNLKLSTCHLGIFTTKKLS